MIYEDDLILLNFAHSISERFYDDYGKLGQVCAKMRGNQPLDEADREYFQDCVLADLMTPDPEQGVEAIPDRADLAKRRRKVLNDYPTSAQA